MKTSVFIFLSLLSVSSIQAKTFKFTHSQSGQTMTVFCFNPDSASCQNRLAEARQRLLNGTSADESTLAGEQTREGLAQARDQFSSDMESAGSAIRDGANATGAAIANGADAAGAAVERGIDNINGQTYRVRVPGHEHTMTFHCFGGQGSDECKEEQAIVVEAIKNGSQAASLEEIRTEPIRNAANTVAEAAVEATNGAQNFVSRQGHNYCKTKLERHARNFDENYALNGTELVSYEEKMNYIEAQLSSEGKLDDCQLHFDNALLGYQLEWASRGQVVQERTHVYDGLGRLADGQWGYWKSEERSNRAPAAQNR